MIPADPLLEAYCNGIFPMAMDDGEIAWFELDCAIIPVDQFHVPHGLKRRLRDHRFEIRIDCALNCSAL